MKKEVGLWIDQHKTVMVTLEDEKEETREIRSNVEQHMRLSNDLKAKKPNVPAHLHAEDLSDGKDSTRLSGYFDGVVSMLRNADSIWIFGPGQAKDELKKRLKHEDLDGRIVGIETVNKMTDHQIAAKVRDHFLR